MDLDAYGFIAARGEGVHLLGCQYETSIFASRAPEDHVLLRAIVGGSFDPGALDLTDEALVSRTCEDLQRAAGLRQAPDFTAVWRHPLGIPQYTLGHAQRCATIAEGLKAHPGLFITGNALRGVGVADCIGNAEALAAQWSTSSVAPAG
jgi:oxygen-dependent protoporphyrinogen oxidase